MLIKGGDVALSPWALQPPSVFISVFCSLQFPDISYYNETQFVPICSKFQSNAYTKNDLQIHCTGPYLYCTYFKKTSRLRHAYVLFGSSENNLLQSY
jgi:hypothetical protein